jgi:hypothetical protein
VAVYSFLDALVAIAGPNGNFSIGGPGIANTEGGVTITMTEDKNTMAIGAGGEVMHSLHAGKSGTVSVRTQKTAPVNRQLSEMYATDTQRSGLHGRNTIAIRDLSRGDVITCRDVAFAKFADVTYAKDGGEMVWNFHAGQIDFDLGSGIDLAAVA